MTINLEDDANVELDDMDITVVGGRIAFSVEGEITNIPSEILNEFTGSQVYPVEIAFEKKD